MHRALTLPGAGHEVLRLDQSDVQLDLDRVAQQLGFLDAAGLHGLPAGEQSATVMALLLAVPEPVSPARLGVVCSG